MGKDTRFVASVNLVEGNALAARTHGTAAEVAVNNDISYVYQCGKVFYAVTAFESERDAGVRGQQPRWLPPREAAYWRKTAITDCAASTPSPGHKIGRSRPASR